MLKKKVIIAVTACVAIVGLVGCGKKEAEKSENKPKNDWQKIEEKGEFVVGVDDSFVPMGFRDENDEIVGFDIDLAKAVGKELNVDIKIQPIEWTMKETELKNGTIDCIWNGYTTSAEREKQVSFSNTYLQNEQILITLKKSKIDSYEGMKDKIVGVQEGSSGLALMEENPEVLLDYVKDQEPVLYGNFVEAFMDLDSGRIDGLLIARVFAEYYIAHQEDNKNDYTLIPSKFEKQDFAVGMRKGETSTVKQINKGLKAVYDKGVTKEISEKWFGEDIVVPQK